MFFEDRHSRVLRLCRFFILESIVFLGFFLISEVFLWNVYLTDEVEVDFDMLHSMPGIILQRLEYLTGHAQADMVTDLYAHILDEDRKINAQRFEAAFYANSDMRKVEREIVEQSKPQPQASEIDLKGLFEQLQQNPKVLGQLAALLKGA